MSRALPPVDAHAHIKTGIDERELRDLRSVVFAVTREPSEWDAALKRRDAMCVWGIGCHPGVPEAFESFDLARFAEAVAQTPLIGEVGLDGRSPVAMDEQREVFRAVLAVAKQQSRLVTIHSVHAAEPVLEELEAVGGLDGAILHWWRGDGSATAHALELGCYFSLNGAEAVKPRVIELLPRERVLTETDFPHTRRTDRQAARPGQVATIERALSDAWELDEMGLRRQLWKNLAAICSRTATAGLMPRQIQASLLAAR